MNTTAFSIFLRFFEHFLCGLRIPGKEQKNVISQEIFKLEEFYFTSLVYIYLEMYYMKVKRAQIALNS